MNIKDVIGGDSPVCVLREYKKTQLFKELNDLQLCYPAYLLQSGFPNTNLQEISTSKFIRLDARRYAFCAMFVTAQHSALEFPTRESHIVQLGVLDLKKNIYEQLNAVIESNKERLQLKDGFTSVAPDKAVFYKL